MARKLRTFVIMYKLRGEEPDDSVIDAAIRKAEHSVKVGDSSWVVHTRKTSKHWRHKLRKIVGPDDWVSVLPLNHVIM